MTAQVTQALKGSGAQDRGAAASWMARVYPVDALLFGLFMLDRVNVGPIPAGVLLTVFIGVVGFLRAPKLIQQVGGTILGTVLHRARPNALGDAVYGAGYGGKYQSYYGQGYLAGKAEDPTPITAQPQTAVFEVDPADAALTTEVNEAKTRAARRRA